MIKSIKAVGKLVTRQQSIPIPFFFVLEHHIPLITLNQMRVQSLILLFVSLFVAVNAAPIVSHTLLSFQIFIINYFSGPWGFSTAETRRSSIQTGYRK